MRIHENFESKNWPKAARERIFFLCESIIKANKESSDYLIPAVLVYEAGYSFEFY
jgi:hypothetical protein